MKLGNKIRTAPIVYYCDNCGERIERMERYLAVDSEVEKFLTTNQTWCKVIDRKHYHYKNGIKCGEENINNI